MGGESGVRLLQFETSTSHLFSTAIHLDFDFAQPRFFCIFVGVVMRIRN